MRENQFLKEKNNLLELQKDFMKLKDIELKDREVKIKREIEEILCQPIFVSIHDMDKFEQKVMKKIRPIETNQYDCLINYIPKPIRKSAGGFKDKIVSLFKTSTPKQTAYGRGQKLSKPKTPKQTVYGTGKKLCKPKTPKIRNTFVSKKKFKDRIITDISTLFEKEEEKEERKKLVKKA